jgi:hypothetical protein
MNDSTRAQMLSVDACALRDDRTTLLNPQELEGAISKAVKRLTTDTECSETADDEIRSLDGEMARIAEAVAGGRDVPALVRALRDREARPKTLLDRTPRSRAAESKLAMPQIREELRSRLNDWRELLNSAPAEAQMLRLLVVDRLEMRPTPRGYEFRGQGTVRPILEGLIASRGRLLHLPDASTFTTSSHSAEKRRDSRKGRVLGMASLSIPSWNQIAGFLESMRQLRESARFAA